ncbi:acid phosphatase [Mollisia scopiformis]|uniref:3-phytase n=1 Tax=Mollisia scopiformis TaxID=149040 RepID=A0A194WZW8_MOLSC|nr:acid phosphatase [Mollisia scopiformis]KUJ13249.1 acid phosphatase [Mollisia scopiformis]
MISFGRLVVAIFATGSSLPSTFYYGYSILKHYGGNGPYSDRVSYGIDRNPPAGCAVDQVIGLFRHGERYPDPSTGKEMVAALDKLYAANTTFKGDLAFLNDWTYFVPSTSYYAQETFTGPYAGLLTAYSHGTEYGARYGYLWDGHSDIPIFSSGYERVIETARKLGEGFFGYNYSSVVALNIIPEADSQAANSLTPSYSLTGSLPIFDVAAARIMSQNPAVNISASNVYYLMQMAAFELNARPFSDWIDVFTLDEWASFGYTQDLSYYYSVGQVYVNATATLLNDGPRNGSLFWSFAHDTNITPVIAALGILNPSQSLPTDRVAWGNRWSTGNIVPMQGHVILERLSCNATAIALKDTYVRIVLNEAVVPLQNCQNGPGYSCSLSNYTNFVSTLPSFTESCGIPADVSQHLNFFWNWNNMSIYDYQNGTIPYHDAATNV